MRTCHDQGKNSTTNTRRHPNDGRSRYPKLRPRERAIQRSRHSSAKKLGDRRKRNRQGTAKCLATRTTEQHLILTIKINGNPTTALIDSGSNGNYISPRIVNRYQLPWIQKEEPYPLATFDGSPVTYDGGMVRRETAHLTMTTGTRKEQVRFDITGTASYPVILGIPWLKKSNPRIDWANGQLFWENEPTQSPRNVDDLANGEGQQRPVRKSRLLKTILAMVQRNEIGYQGSEEKPAEGLDR